jgi:hypothetical protein
LVSFASKRGLPGDGCQAQWFIDGQAAFTSSMENAKSEVFFFLLILNCMSPPSHFKLYFILKDLKLYADIHYWLVALPITVSRASIP